VRVSSAGVRAFIVPLPRDAARGVGSKTIPREGRQGVGGARSGMRQGTVSGVPATATQGTEAENQQWQWAEASIWTERMVSALVNGVKGGKWFSLVDKVIRPTTLAIAWHKVARNKGVAGVDGQSIERFAAQSERYLQELHDSLKDGSYRPTPVKRVEIPKGDGRSRPLGIPTVKDRIVQTALKMVIEPIFGAPGKLASSNR
jgi:RNA-directed DNA polymerase